jgi:hypothetical protein
MHTSIAGPLVGAFRNFGHEKIEVLNTMKPSGYDIRESEPFDSIEKILKGL